MATGPNRTAFSGRSTTSGPQGRRGERVTAGNLDDPQLHLQASWSSQLVTCLVAVQGFRMLKDFRMQHKAHFRFQPRAFECSKWSPVLKNVSLAKAGQL